MTPRFDVIVIGAGANGLAAAATLARAGRRVLLLEREGDLGGQDRTVEFAPGFRAAPLNSDAGWVPPLVARQLRVAVPELVMPDIAVSAPTRSGHWLSLPSHPQRAAQVLRPWSVRDAGAWAGFVTSLRRLSGFLEVVYQLDAPDLDAGLPADLGTLLAAAWQLRTIGRRRVPELLRTLPMSVQELLDDQFEHETLKAAVGAGGVQGISQGPRSGGTAFVLLHHLVGAPPGSVRARGWWRAGPEALTRALEQVARRYGVAIRTRATVAQILVRDDAVAGVVLQGGEEIPASLVLSTADPKHTLLGLVPPAWLDPEFLHAVRQIKYRGATAYALFALDALPPVAEFTLSTEALASVVSLTPDLEGLERAADAAKYGMVSEWPHIELTVPTLRWPALAPEGRHVAVARVQWAPYHLRAGRWDPAQRTALEEVVARAIGDAIPGFPDRVTHCTLLAPPDLEVHFGLTEGAATHGEVTLDQMLFMRPVPGWAHHAMPITGLHLGSAGTHPGPGIAGGPGWLAARRVLAGQR